MVLFCGISYEPFVPQDQGYVLEWGKEEEDSSRGVNVEEREGEGIVKCTYGGGFGLFESRGKKGRAAGQ
jgi:hypothetical protein